MVRAIWRWLIAGPSVEPRGSAWAFRELQQREADAIASGARLGATVLHKRAHPRIHIGAFRAKLLRMKR